MGKLLILGMLIGVILGIVIQHEYPRAFDFVTFEFNSYKNRDTCPKGKICIDEVQLKKDTPTQTAQP